MTANGNKAVTLSQLKMFTESSNSGGIGYTDPGIVGFATGDEVVTLKQLKMLRDSLTDDILGQFSDKLDTIIGVSGDVNAQLDTLDETKTAIKDAIIAKGVEVPEGTVFRDYATKIGEIESGPHSVIVTVYSNYAPFPSLGRSGIYFTDTNGQIQTAHIEEIGEQISFSAMPGSMVLLASSYDVDAKVSGNAELAIDGMVELYYDGRMASLVFVYGKCEIHC